MDVRLVSAFNDNYLFVVPFAGSADCFVVDPGDASLVLSFLKESGLNLAGILVTHHHADHIGGIKTLLAQTSCERVIGPSYDTGRIPFITEPVSDGDTFMIGGFEASVIFTPGHTRGHICYHFSNEGVLFCGDTLFAAGCGRMFEGHKEEMWTSLQRLAKLPSATRVYCAHEYTMANIRFVRSLGGDSCDLDLFQSRCEALLTNGDPTVPTTIGTELTINPFLRAADADEFGRLRGLKDIFRG